jgi:hypothetical protein
MERHVVEHSQAAETQPGICDLDNRTIVLGTIGTVGSQVVGQVAVTERHAQCFLLR